MRASTDGLLLPRADPLLALALAVFRSEWSVVTLVSRQRHMYVANATAGKAWALGMEIPWTASGCGFTLVPQHHEVLVVPDMHADARCGGRRVTDTEPKLLARGQAASRMCCCRV